MNVTLTRFVENRPRARNWLREGQSLTVGKSMRADLWVEDDPRLDDVHFVVTVDAGACRVRSLTTPVMINGRPMSETVLKDRDTILAGACEFRVTIEGAETTMKPADGVVDAPRTRTLQVLGTETVTQLGHIQVVEGKPYLAEVVQRLGEKRAMFALVNFKRARAVPPEGCREEDDLFSHAPKEIRATESLHLVGIDDPDAVARLQESVQTKDAAVFVISDKPQDIFIDSHKLYWGWFSRPSILTLQFTRGSADLAQKLLQDVYAVAMEAPASDNIIFYAHLEHVAEIMASLRAMEFPIPGNEE